ncbi:YciC family protein [Candidatus Pseudomonas adelgestsugas]|nr:YciC family protein [Candidatus Pseudomonas adelgestsugas]
MNPLDILRDSFRFTQLNLGAIIQLCLPLVIPEALLQQVLNHILGQDAFPGYNVVAGLLVYPLYTGALIMFLDARTHGKSPNTKDIWTIALNLWPRFALLTAISTLLILLGLSLYVLPGLCLMVILAFAEYLLVLRSMSVLEAMKESVRLTHRRFWLILVCLLCVMTPLWLLKGASEVTYPNPTLLLGVLIDSTYSFLQLFASVVLFRLFMLIDDDA